MINLKNKKGAELAIGAMVLLVLGIIVLVVVVLGFWKGWDYVFGKIGFLPNDLNAAVESCKLYANQEALQVSFCEYKILTLNGVKGYWNCNGVIEIAKKSQSDATLGGLTTNDKCMLAEDFCKSIATSLGEGKKVKINGVEYTTPSSSGGDCIKS